jgi:hypothetical protein
VPADRRIYRAPAYSDLMANTHCHTCLIDVMSMRMALSSPLDLAVKLLLVKLRGTKAWVRLFLR